MKTFTDLEFKEKPFGMGIHARMNFSNGYELSVVAGEYCYSNPRRDFNSPDDYHEFEVAVFKDGDFTRELYPDHTDDVLGWQTRAQINTLMWQLQTGW